MGKRDPRAGSGDSPRYETKKAANSRTHQEDLMKLLRSTVCVFALSLGACSEGTAPAAPAPITALPRELSTAEIKVIAASNDFAFDLFRVGNLSQHKQNVFISPLSASMALGMTANGANGATYAEMRTTLHWSESTRQEVNGSYKSLIALLRNLDPRTDFAIANSIWYERSFPFNTSFLEESKEYFDATVTALDFASPSAVGTINSWVSDQTKAKIPTILDAIDQAEVMFLINAIYFKGSWQKGFDKSKTDDAPFFNADGTRSTVRMMARGAGVESASNAEYQAVDLPYGNSAFTMTVVMPNEADIDTFAESFDLTKWNALAGSLHDSDRIVQLPRFRMEWERLLNGELIQLGMQSAFSAADFTRMSPRGEELFISRVLQKTYVDVDEEGTEAAAATMVGIGFVSAPVAFRADKPFLVVIRERFSGTILFIGKIARLPA